MSGAIVTNVQLPFITDGLIGVGEAVDVDPSYVLFFSFRANSSINVLGLTLFFSSFRNGEQFSNALPASLHQPT